MCVLFSDLVHECVPARFVLLPVQLLSNSEDVSTQARLGDQCEKLGEVRERRLKLLHSIFRFYIRSHGTCFFNEFSPFTFFHHDYHVDKSHMHASYFTESRCQL